METITEIKQISVKDGTTATRTANNTLKKGIKINAFLDGGVLPVGEGVAVQIDNPTLSEMVDLIDTIENSEDKGRFKEKVYNKAVSLKNKFYREQKTSI